MVLVDEVKGTIKRAAIAAAQFINLDNTFTAVADELMILPAVKSSEYESDIEGRVLRAFEEEKVAIRGTLPKQQNELMKHRMW